MIASTFEGRLRVRANILKAKGIAKGIQAKVEDLPGVRSTRINPAAASIIVHFDTEEVDAMTLEEEIMDICQPAPKKKSNGKSVSTKLHQATKVGMMTTLATSVAYGFMGKKTPHIRYGAAFVVFAGMHMLKYSNRLLR